MTRYSDKLKSPKWQRKRLEILNRDNFTCQTCQDTETELHVHHKSYFGEPWEAPDEDLITLCKICHAVQEHLGDSHIIKIIKYSYKTWICKLTNGDVALVLLDKDVPYTSVRFARTNIDCLNTIIDLLNEQPYSTISKPIEENIFDEF